MPGMPDVEALARFLGRQLEGATVASLQLGSFTALKTVDPAPSALAGAAIGTVSRRGKMLLIEAGDLILVAHLFRAGWVAWRTKVPASVLRPGKGTIVARLATSAGAADFTEAGTQRRLSLWLTRDPGDVDMVAGLGPEALDLAADPAAWRAALAARPARAKTWLTDQHVLAGIGNGFSDDILHAARLSPFAPTATMSGDDAEALRLATTSVLTGALAALDGLAPAKMKDAKKAAYRVHDREGQPCPACGTAIRSVHFSGHSLQYCPTCQTGGKPLADRTTSRFVK